jgi:hypothetical protein
MFSADLRIFLTGSERRQANREFCRPTSGSFSLSIGEVAIGRVLPLCSHERILFSGPKERDQQ